MPKKIRVCVVGAGPSGLSFLYHVNKLKKSIASDIQNTENMNLDVVCYEKHSTLGGLWNMSWRVGTLMQKYEEKSFRLKYQSVLLYLLLFTRS